MYYTIPDYYREFTCIADRCPDTCCAGWEIVIDEASLRKYRRMKGAMKNRLHNSIDWEKGEFLQYKGRCAFLDENNLCDLYAEGGQKMLCRTCRMHPRHVEEFEGVRELSLCISCPEAARIVLGKKEPVRFLHGEKEGEEDYGDFDFLLYTKLVDAREVAIRILQDRTRPIRERMAMALALAHDLQVRIKNGRLFEADELFLRYEKPGAKERFAVKLAQIQENYGNTGESSDLLARFFERIEEMEPLRADWPEHLKDRDISPKKESGDWEIWQEQLMVYFVFTYFCGAVYDERAFARMAFGVLCTMAIRQLTLGFWDGKEESIFDTLLEEAHRFCREMEHSDENREAAMSWANACRMEELVIALTTE